jgi:hypothetical protein
MAPRPEGGPAAAAPRGTNVVAFRFKVRGGAYEIPRLPTALNDLATRGRLAADVGAVERRRFPVSAEPAAAAVSQPLRAAIAGQGAEIERLARSNEEQRQLLERLDQRLTAGPTTPDLATDLAALRAATARHGQQLVSLAIAVHRLAKLLAAETTPGRR